MSVLGVKSVESAPELIYEPGSFRDREGRVVYRDGEVYRVLSKKAYDDFLFLKKTHFFQSFLNTGQLVATKEATFEGVRFDQEWHGVLRHERIPFLSYPYEWSFSMLKAAALLQLDLLIAALKEQMTLKDASSFNVQWQGCLPVFIDVCSFEKWQPGTPWAGYRQFCQLFLYPLFLQAYKNVSFQRWLRGRLDGIEIEEMNRLLGFFDLFKGGVFKHVYLHNKLKNALSGTKTNIKAELKAAGFHHELIQANAKRLRALVSSLTWKESTSVWADYVTQTSYTDADDQAKVRFVDTVVSQKHRHLVWDLGCNTGRYSRIAAKNADYVVAFDSDHLSIERLYRQLAEEGNRKILPLVSDISDPSPNLGWRGLERKSITNREKPELILALALIHHLVISANIPLDELVQWLSTLESDLVIEFVTKEDVMVKRLLQNKEDIYWDYSIENFETCLSKYYRIEKKEQLQSNTRILYSCVRQFAK